MHCSTIQIIYYRSADRYINRKNHRMSNGTDVQLTVKTKNTWGMLNSEL